MAETAPCKKCTEEISTEAKRCPECGYEPSSHGRWWRQGGMLIGFILTITLVGAIVGIPLMILSWYGNKQADRWTPTNKAL